ncbi:hypothetical protein JMJ77_0008252 [Colletotrichum scovillei]|uniref:WSC domain-containing protein n=1 Tax=Colletotrichum scovillei TaxID=1209932 RepID=A0A9P7RGT7_9PEZI|nr:hypothetical protein JMJ77_0008252 [Colletotrichum scovillei]KAG7075243.1 hypothetical protein JMJ76_0011704 [Colletotrichum scovillei]KAG7082238.1 hypothetical protein JMJ78_0004341 [Colletotrichum scovillei]
MVSDVDLLFNPYVANQPVECQQYCKTNRRTITMMSKFLCICSILVPGAVTPFSSEIPPNDNYCTNPCSSFPSAPCGGAIPFELGAPVYTVYELDESQLNSTSSSSSSTISSTSTTSSLSSSSVASHQFALLLKHNLASDNFKPVSDLEHFSLDYTSVKRSQQRRIISYNFTAFLNVPYFSPFFSPCFSLF